MRIINIIKLLAFIVVIFGSISSAHSEISLEKYNRYKDSTIKDVRVMVTEYVRGVGNGYYWANATLKARGQKMLYCQPENHVLNAQNYKDILEREIENNPYKPNDQIEMILIFGLIKTYYCK